ncbi:hypothetical protein BGX21_000907 [Mortierella sp. AD011]|nr:hypothetical protein BGX20_001218 [Mortierella sp. AD010]KAF9386049.1 hypothetical protein BGX21_000907 [Mortierella sp. AD011]
MSNIRGNTGVVGENVDVHRFFKIVDARNWDRVDTFFKFRDNSKTAGEHADVYKNGLDIISTHESVEANIQRRAKFLISKFVRDDFVEKFTALMLDTGRKQAEKVAQAFHLSARQSKPTSPSEGALNNLQKKKYLQHPKKTESEDEDDKDEDKNDSEAEEELDYGQSSTSFKVSLPTFQPDTHHSPSIRTQRQQSIKKRRKLSKFPEVFALSVNMIATTPYFENDENVGERFFQFQSDSLEIVNDLSIMPTIENFPCFLSVNAIWDTALDLDLAPTTVKSIREPLAYPRFKFGREQQLLLLDLEHDLVENRTQFRAGDTDAQKELIHIFTSL